MKSSSACEIHSTHADDTKKHQKLLTLISHFRSIRGSLSREVSMSPEEELAARERKRSVKFKDKANR